MDIIGQFTSLFSNFGNLTWQMLVMWIVGGLLIYLAIAKKMEPSLLLPMGFGAILVNLPLSGAITQGDTEGPLSVLFQAGMSNELFPLLLFIGIGAMIDFGPLLEKPWLMLFGAAAQFGIFFTLAVAGLFFPLTDAASIAVNAAGRGLDKARRVLREERAGHVPQGQDVEDVPPERPAEARRPPARDASPPGESGKREVMGKAGKERERTVRDIPTAEAGPRPEAEIPSEPPSAFAPRERRAAPKEKTAQVLHAREKPTETIVASRPQAKKEEISPRPPSPGPHRLPPHPVPWGRRTAYPEAVSWSGHFLPRLLRSRRNSGAVRSPQVMT